MEPPQALRQWLQAGGMLAITIYIIWSGTRKNPIWVPGEQHREQIADLRGQVRDAKEECEEWKMLALKSTMLADRAVGDASRAVAPMRGRGDRSRAKASPEHD